MIYGTKVDPKLKYLVEPEGDILVNMEETAIGFEGQKVGQIYQGVAYFSEPEDAVRGVLHDQELNGQTLEDLVDGRKISKVEHIRDVIKNQLGLETQSGYPDVTASEVEQHRYEMAYINTKGKQKTFEFADGHKGFGVKVEDFESALEYAEKATAGWGVTLVGVEYAEDFGLDEALAEITEDELKM